MSNELKRYNHLNYGIKQSESHENDDFIDFLYKNSNLPIPETNEEVAWDRFTQKLAQKKHQARNQWLKIAATILVIFSVALSLILVDTKADLIQVASKDQIKSISFPDGSTGILNENSQFAFPENFGMERNVSFIGEAYFDIMKSEKPFIIDAGGVDVKVLGTAFNLITNEDVVKLYVDRGLVAFSKDGVETKVGAGHEAIFNKKTGNVEIKDVPSLNIMSWRNGDFQFNNTPLKDALEDLSNYYDVEFKFSNEKLLSCRISASIKNKSIGEVLNLLESILDVKTKQKGQIVKISGKGC